MHPRQMLRELERAMPKDAMVSTDIGNICSVANSYLRFERPRSMFARDELRQLRLRVPDHDRLQGRGARIARRSRTSATARGRMSFGEILTCVREKIPTTAVVFNNQQWGAEKKNQVDFYGNRFVGVEPREPELRGHRALDGRRGHHGRQGGRRRSGAARGLRGAEGRQDDHPRDDGHARTRRSVPPRRAEAAACAIWRSTRHSARNR